MVHDIVLEHEGAQARPLAMERRRIRTGRRGNLVDRSIGTRRIRPLAAIVVVDPTLALLLGGESDGEVGVEVAPE